MIRGLIYVAWLISFSVAIGYALWLLVQLPTKRWGESAFDYVYVEDDGTARALSAEEEEQLSTAFLPDDETQPYIKPQYESLSSDGRLRGYLRRRQLPKGIYVGRPLSDERG
ncbi:MAG: hypothetical protein ACR2LM_18565 [Pyrinomonadaceae bacterium]